MNALATGRAWWTAAGVAVLLSAIGAALLAWSIRDAAEASRALRAARDEHAVAEKRLAAALRGSDLVREIERTHAELVFRGIVNQERRLEWAESLAKSREARRVAELRFQIEPRRALNASGADGTAVVAFASLLKLQTSLLHEGELLGLLTDLRRDAKALHVPRRCVVQRLTSVGPDAGALRLRAECDIDLITFGAAEARP